MAFFLSAFAGGMVAQAKKADLDMDELGARLLARKEELLAAIIKEGLPAPTTRTYKGHELDAGEPVEKAA